MYSFGTLIIVLIFLLIYSISLSFFKVYAVLLVTASVGRPYATEPSKNNMIWVTKLTLRRVVLYLRILFVTRVRYGVVRCNLLHRVNQNFVNFVSDLFLRLLQLLKTARKLSCLSLGLYINPYRIVFKWIVFDFNSVRFYHLLKFICDLLSAFFQLLL